MINVIHGRKFRRHGVLAAMITVLILALFADTTKTSVFSISAAATQSVESTSVIDYSNADKGYITITYSGKSNVAVLITPPGKSPKDATYKPAAAYLSTGGAFVLNGGSGGYSVKLAEFVGEKAKVVNSATFTANIANESEVYLLPSFYVRFDANAPIVNLGKSISGAEADTLKKVEKIYSWFVDNVSYDRKKAQSSKSNGAQKLSEYVPDLDGIVNRKTGICFDYAAAMAAMLRSQGVPTKVIMGTVSGIADTHAWVSVWVTGKGWVSAVQIKSNTWSRMDPTFAATSKNSKAFLAKINDGKSYIDVRIL